MELGCRFLVHYICREMLINAYEVFCPSVPVCIKIVDGGARRRRRAVCAVIFLILLFYNIIAEILVRCLVQLFISLFF